MKFGACFGAFALKSMPLLAQYGNDSYIIYYSDDGSMKHPSHPCAAAASVTF
jgi:hypothetical protein